MDDKGLRAAYSAAKSLDVKKKPFEVAGEDINIPRLTLGHRAQFENWMHQNKSKDYSISQQKRRAQFKWAEILEDSLRAWGEENEQDWQELAPEERERLFGKLRAQVMRRWPEYIQTLLAPLDQEAVQQAVTLAMKQEYGDEATEEVISTVLSVLPGSTVDEMAGWALGLEEWVEDVSKRADELRAQVQQAKSPEEAAEAELGDPKKSASGPAKNSTSMTTSPSSASPTDETKTGPGA